MTLEEWAELSGDDDDGELVDGVLMAEEEPDFLHEVIVAWFIRVLGNWIAPRGGPATGGDLSAIPGCDGLTLDLDQLWREVDRLAAGDPSA